VQSKALSTKGIVNLAAANMPALRQKRFFEAKPRHILFVFLQDCFRKKIYLRRSNVRRCTLSIIAATSIFARNAFA
jgi:hypothetical protein